MIDLTNCRAFTAEPGTVENRVATLERIVLDVLMEIEALRTAMIAVASPQGPEAEDGHALNGAPAGVSGPHTVYGKTYLKTAWLTHWSAGPTCGQDKLLEQFYGNEYNGETWNADRWRRNADALPPGLQPEAACAVCRERTSCGKVYLAKVSRESLTIGFVR